ncbi:conjugal transfer protein TraN [Chachezhania sediminis]|uniref:conjugal transfer protein TraN n=1 Tax=Chachezhania sediminis TaxID=2599291 RepID=UPI00131C5F9C|nr:conjugal transfer protein TraN [Chachezhania sediminis]
MIPRVLGILFAALLFAGSASAEETCERPRYDCQSRSNATVAGFSLVGYCSKSVGSQACSDSDPLNECKAVAASVNCTQVSSDCVDYRNGACRQRRKVFDCLNEDADMAPAMLEKTEFGPVEEEIRNRCETYEVDEACDLDRTETVQGAATREINRKDFARAWWRKRRSYECIVPGEGDNDCGPLESDPLCHRVGDTCLVADENGICSNREYHYKCGEDQRVLETSCEPINVCVGDLCLGAEQEPSEDFGDAAAWLNLLAEMQADARASGQTDANAIRFFQGERHTCSKVPGRDCCDLSGVLTGVQQCPEEAEILADERATGRTHYVGDDCELRFLGACIRRRYVYCAFKSKLGRVFVEEIKAFKGEAWGWPDNPDCGYVTVEDFANIDVGDLDLSEVFGDMLAGAKLPVQEGIEAFYANRFPGAPKTAQDLLTGDRQ